MARTAESVQAEIDALRSRMAKGILRVKHGDTETTYASIADMLAAIRALEGEAALLADTPVKAFRFMTSKGMDA